MRKRGDRKARKVFVISLLAIILLSGCETKRHIPMRRHRPCHDCPTFSQLSENSLNDVCIATVSKAE